MRRFRRMKMNSIKTVGLVIADTDEYVHIENAFPNATNKSVKGLKGHTVSIDTSSGTVTLRTVCSGIGKVNAAIAATLIADECDVIVNAGLSGGFGDAATCGLIAGTEFVEHDFDLTAIGYAASQKPGQTQRLRSDETLLSDLLLKFPFVSSGLFVTGDSFICSGEKHDALVKNFNPIACDMESAAIAEVAARFNKPYLSLRMVSDGANDDSPDTYTDVLKCDRADGWLGLVLDWLKTL